MTHFTSWIFDFNSISHSQTHKSFEMFGSRHACAANDLTRAGQSKADGNTRTERMKWTEGMKEGGTNQESFCFRVEYFEEMMMKWEGGGGKI